jgi:hypothetical protein
MVHTTSRDRPASANGAWHATLQIRRVLVDIVEEITYDQGRLLQQSRNVNVGGQGEPTELDRPARAALLAELREERSQQPAGVDLRALDAFIDILGAVMADR